MTEWKKLCAVDAIPLLGSRVVNTGGEVDVAIFRDAEGAVFALRDKCPHKGGPLSQGIVAGRQVTCPLHSWKISLENGEAQAPDIGCAHSLSVKVVDDQVWLDC